MNVAITRRNGHWEACGWHRDRLIIAEGTTERNARIQWHYAAAIRDGEECLRIMDGQGMIIPAGLLDASIEALSDIKRGSI